MTRSAMRISVVTDAWYPQPNGVVRVMSTVVDRLKDQGHEVQVISPNLFTTLPCPTYPEIRLSLMPGRTVARMLTEFAPDAIHIATEGPLGAAAGPIDDVDCSPIDPPAVGGFLRRRIGRELEVLAGRGGRSVVGRVRRGT